MLARPFFKTAALATALAIPLALAVAAPATAATVPVTTWTALQAAFLTDGDTVVLDANITAPSGESLAMDTGETIILDLSGHTLTITNPPSNVAAIEVPDTSTLTINATGGGTLTATGGYVAAAIGGGNNGNGGTTTINGGTITANGGDNAAGIGGGNGGGVGGTTTINGGTITATGGELAAGIGGGNDSNGGTTTINGGTTIATGGTGSAGIGGSVSGSSGTTTLTGGNITATGGTNSAGIGGGSGGSIGVLDIQGTPDTGAATDGGGSPASPITNAITPSGVGYAATTSMVETGGKIIVGFHYLVTFAAAGGDSTPADATINYGATLAAPANPSRAGYTFSGWTASGTAYNFSSPVTSPLTLTAAWTAAVTPASSDLLPATGNDATPAISSAVLLLLAGLTLIAVRRRTSTR